MTTCYACDANANSIEHIPPKCIFPKDSEYDGRKSRVNLLTVNSCPIHNSVKSGDDQLFFSVLAISKSSNNASQFAVRQRFSRGVARRPALVSSILRTGYCNTEGEYVGNINGPRLDAYLSLMGRGLEFFRSGRRVTDEMVTVASTFLFPTDPQIRDTNFKICENAQNLEFIEFGPNLNRETFFSEFIEDEAVTIIKGTFYETLILYWVISNAHI